MMEMFGGATCFMNGSATLRKAYITFLTNDEYFAGVQVLIKTLRDSNCRYPVCVLVGEDVSEVTYRRLSSLAEAVLRVTNIGCQYETDAPNQTQFEKLVYIDADCIVLENIDELFDVQSNFAACPDIFPPDKFNAGVMVLTPDAALFQQMVGSIPRLRSYDGGDTGFLNAFFPDWFSAPGSGRLPFRYNAQRTMYWFTHGKQPGYWEAVQPVKVVHYSSSPKPWQVAMNTKGLGDLELLWWRKSMGF